MKKIRAASVMLFLCAIVALPAAAPSGATAPSAPPPLPVPAEAAPPANSGTSMGDQMKALSDQVAALQSLVQNQQATIQALQKALGQLQQQLAALQRAQNPPPQEPPGPKTATISGNPMRGDPRAPLTLIEFSDFQCPFCGRWEHDTFPQLKKDYIDTGKVRFVYRDLPLSSIHPRALPAALAAECANEQGRYWEYHDVLFDNQTAMTDENLLKWAADLKLDTSAFSSCMTTQKYKAEVDQDTQDALKAGINGTPGFIVGPSRPDGSVQGIYISGAVPYDVFKQAIEALLKAPLAPVAQNPRAPAPQGPAQNPPPLPAIP